MQNNICFRKIQSSDYKPLEKIICDTWNYEQFCSKKTARQMSKLYLASCLANQTFTCVAENNGEPVGIIMGKNERTHRISLHYAIRCFFSIAAIALSKEGRTISRFFEGIDHLNQSLLKECNQTFDGELAFFAIRSDQRGTGIGQSLFNQFLDYMRSQNIPSFYLYTDTTCNFGFYEHQGMKRIKEKLYRLNSPMKKEMLFFLYASDTIHE